MQKKAELPKHLLFYDGSCGLCDHLVQWLLKTDTQSIFAFAPLQGETAAKFLADLPSHITQADSLILVENYQSESPTIHLFGKGAFRICWLLGGLYSLPGSFYFLPAILYDWGYRLVARHRHRFFSKETCHLPDPSTHNRFLP